MQFDAKGDWTQYKPAFHISENCDVIEKLPGVVEGAQATLYASLWNGKKAVLKLFHNSRRMDKEHERRLRDMYQKLDGCSHAAPIWEFGEHEGHWYEIIPYYAKGSLADRRDSIFGFQIEKLLHIVDGNRADIPFSEVRQKMLFQICFIIGECGQTNFADLVKLKPLPCTVLKDDRRFSLLCCSSSRKDNPLVDSKAEISVEDFLLC